MKLDPTVMRTMNSQDFRVMEAVEKGMKDHELVPMALISSIANLRHGGTHKIISSLLRDKLLSHERKKHGFDGYRLTNAGYDILALHNLKSRGFIAAFGQKIGTGKESDVYLAVNPTGKQLVLKFHRLGRTSFRNVRKKRDYFGSKNMAQQAHSWLFLSRLSALKEYAFMKALFDVQYPTPMPIAHNRHIVAMSLVRGVPLYQIFPKQLSVEQAADIYEQATNLACRLARHGLVHCDLNEFNLLVDLSGIQFLATNSEDPYVRHSGQTVANSEKSMGLLSKPAWEQSLEDGDQIKEALPEPVARLENGEPKPVVVLIDFPQMISTKHPNAEEYYDRDMACLRRFFELKLLCTIPDDVGTDLTWQAVMHNSSSEEALSADDRLDEELRASGFSESLKGDLELYYFESGPTPVPTALPEEESESDDDEDDQQEEGDGSESEEEDGDTDEHVDANSVNIDAVSEKDITDKEKETDVALLGLGEPDLLETVVESLDQVKLDGYDLDKIEARAKAKVRRQLEEQKSRARKQSAFRKQNSNKKYIKGKRILNDAF
jgi:RIO kinase 2